MDLQQEFEAILSEYRKLRKKDQERQNVDTSDPLR